MNTNTFPWHCLVENLLSGRSAVECLIRSIVVAIMPEPVCSEALLKLDLFSSFSRLLTVGFLKSTGNLFSQVTSFDM